MTPNLGLHCSHVTDAVSFFFFFFFFFFFSFFFGLFVLFSWHGSYMSVCTLIADFYCQNNR